MSTAPRGSSGRASGRRCWPTPNWPTGSSAGPTRAAYRSCCTGQTERCMPRPAPALTWRPAAGGHNQRWLRHLPMARQHLPVRRWQHRAQPGQHARALLPDAHPERAHRGPRLHIGVADLSHRRGSSQKTPFCAPRTDPTEEAVPLQNERLGARLSRALRTVGNPDHGSADSGEVVFLCIAGTRRELPLLPHGVCLRRSRNERY